MGTRGEGRRERGYSGMVGRFGGAVGDTRSQGEY